MNHTEPRSPAHEHCCAMCGCPELASLGLWASQWIARCRACGWENRFRVIPMDFPMFDYDEEED